MGHQGRPLGLLKVTSVAWLVHEEAPSVSQSLLEFFSVSVSGLATREVEGLCVLC